MTDAYAKCINGKIYFCLFMSSSKKLNTDLNLIILIVTVILIVKIVVAKDGCVTARLKLMKAMVSSGQTYLIKPRHLWNSGANKCFGTNWATFNVLKEMLTLLFLVTDYIFFSCCLEPASFRASHGHGANI